MPHMKVKDKARNVICTDIRGNKYSVSTDKLSFRPSVYAVIIEKNKVLLSKQWDGYDFPGGGVELGETIEEALKRETWEETGVKIAVGDIVYCKDAFFKFTFGRQKYKQSILMYYLCRKIGGSLTDKNLLDYEKKYTGKPEWIDVDKVKDIKFYNSVDSVEIVRQALRKRKTP